MEEIYAELCGKNDKDPGNCSGESSNYGGSDDKSIDTYNGCVCNDVIAGTRNIVGV